MWEFCEILKIYWGTILKLKLSHIHSDNKNESFEASVDMKFTPRTQNPECWVTSPSYLTSKFNNIFLSCFTPNANCSQRSKRTARFNDVFQTLLDYLRVNIYLVDHTESFNYTHLSTIEENMLFAIIILEAFLVWFFWSSDHCKNIAYI
jgi:hypothetical protein